MEHCVSYKVYYEDTDALGMVYHANYLKFCERGRTEYLERTGQRIRDWNAGGYNVVVRAMQVAFKRPALLGDVLDVVSALTFPTPFRGLFAQRIERAGELLVTAQVEVVCIDARGKPRRFPPVELT